METNESYCVVREFPLLASETGACRFPKMPIIGLRIYNLRLSSMPSVQPKVDTLVGISSRRLSPALDKTVTV